MSLADNLRLFLDSYWIHFLAYELICAGVTGFTAHSKGRRFTGWFLLGILFGIFSVVASIAIPSLTEEGASEDNVLLDPQYHLRSGWRAFAVSRDDCCTLLFVGGGLRADSCGPAPIAVFSVLPGCCAGDIPDVEVYRQEAIRFRRCSVSWTDVQGSDVWSSDWDGDDWRGGRV